MKHITKIIIFIQIAIIIALCISIPRYYKRMEMLENHNTYLEFQLSATSRELKLKSDEVTGLNQQIENIMIRYIADEMYITSIEKRLIGLIGYVVTTNLILEANDIEIPVWVNKYVDDGVVKDGIGGE